MIGTATAVVATVGTGVAAGYGRRRLREVVAGRTPDRVWFHVHPPHVDLWGHTAAVTWDADLHGRFTAGLRSQAPPVLVLAPPPKPDGPTQRSYAGLAALTRPAGRHLLGVSSGDAATVPFAAAGCGLLARPLPDRPAGAREITGTVALEALPGWMVGTGDSGEPVTVNLPPSATVLVRGASARTVAATLPATGRIDGADVVVVTSAAAWRGAWHPQTCRVLVTDGTDGAAGAAASVDLTVDLDAGEVRHGRGVLPFRQLPLR